MKIKFSLLFPIAFMLSTQLSFSQEKNNCTVVDDSTGGLYVGTCKKGLAHGEGVFTYLNGKYMFVGEFKKGKKHGKGQLFEVVNGEKKLLKEGIWKNNVYKGEASIQLPNAYKVQKKVNVERFTVRRNGEGNKIKFWFYQNGGKNTITDLNVFGDSGLKFSDSFSQGNSEGYEDVQYPFKCQVTYKTPNKFKTMTYEVRFEIIIYEPGSWEITLYN